MNLLFEFLFFLEKAFHICVNPFDCAIALPTNFGVSQRLHIRSIFTEITITNCSDGDEIVNVILGESVIIHCTGLDRTRTVVWAYKLKTESRKTISCQRDTSLCGSNNRGTATIDGETSTLSLQNVSPTGKGSVICSQNNAVNQHECRLNVYGMYSIYLINVFHNFVNPSNLYLKNSVYLFVRLFSIYRCILTVNYLLTIFKDLYRQTKHKVSKLVHTAKCKFNTERIALASSSKEVHQIVNTL